MRFMLSGVTRNGREILVFLAKRLREGFAPQELHAVW
jgi:hypothetical protein